MIGRWRATSLGGDSGHNTAAKFLRRHRTWPSVARLRHERRFATRESYLALAANEDASVDEHGAERVVDMHTRR